MAKRVAAGGGVAPLCSSSWRQTPAQGRFPVNTIAKRADAFSLWICTFCFWEGLEGEEGKGAGGVWPKMSKTGRGAAIW